MLDYYKNDVFETKGNKFFNQLDIETLFVGEKADEARRQRALEQSTSEEEADEEEDKENSSDMDQSTLSESKRKPISFARPLSQYSQKSQSSKQSR